MSITVGHSAMPVAVKEVNQPGISFGEIEWLRDEVERTDPEFTELTTALDDVLAEPTLHRGIVRKMREQGRFLIGITDRPGVSRDEYQMGGLLYAEGETEGAGQAGGFSVVRMGTWMADSRLPRGGAAMLRGDLVDMSLHDVRDDSITGVPVNRLTRILPLHPGPGNPAEGYIFGHVKELAAIHALDIPDKLRQVLRIVTKTWHETELGEDGDATLGRLEGELTLRFSDRQQG